MKRFEGRRILVTGAAGGLGTALCARLVAEGAHVIGTDVSAKKLAGLEASIASNAGTLTTACIDQSDPKAAGQAVKTVIATQGKIDSLVNNAGIYPKATAEEQDVDEMRNVIDVNAIAATSIMGAVVPDMRRAGFGRIINVSSITFSLGFAELSAYVASKGALIGLARVWARELGPDGITVNCISPGAFQTDAEKIHPDPEGYNRFVLDQQSIKRRGTPEDFAHAAAFLLDAESGFVTGQNFLIDGGWVMQ